MKKILTLILILTMSNLVSAQSEPKTIKAKDLMDKIDRSELESDTTNKDIDDIIPTLKMPKMNFNQGVEIHNVDKHTKKITTVDNKKTQEILKVKPVPVPAPVPKAKSVPKPKIKTATKTKVIISKKPISLEQLINNDKIVTSNGKTYIYRLKDSQITQYRILEKLPLKSQGLRTSEKNSFYIRDIKQLMADVKATKSAIKPKRTKSKSATKPKRTKSVRNTNKRNTNRRSKSIVTKKPKVKSQTKTAVTITPEVAAKRKSLEEKFNHGKAISKTMGLRKLQVNDEVIISGAVQIVIRRNKSTSGIKKYWLTEKINTSNKALVKKSKNHYKLIKIYIYQE